MRSHALARRDALRTFAALAAAAPFASACSGTRDTRTYGPHVVAISQTTPAALSSDEAQAFMVQRSIPLPIRYGPDDRRDRERTRPYPGPVLFTSDDLRVQISYVLSNVEDREIKVELLVDGWNEFIWYSPQMRVVDDDLVTDRSCVERHILLPPKSRVEGRVSFDDFERMALALGTIMNRAPNPFFVLEPSTKIREEPLSAPYVPPIVDGITGFDLSLRTRVAARVAVEAIVELVDLGGVLMEEGKEFESPNRGRGTGRSRFVPAIAATP